MAIEIAAHARQTRPVALRRTRATLLFSTLAVLLGVAVLLNAGYGAVRVGPDQVIGILFARLGIVTGIDYSLQQEAVVWSIRIPRLLLAGMLGAGLALAGAVLQGVFRNPLADPGLIGVSSGAALGAVAAVLLGFSAFGLFSLPLAAFAGGILTALLVYLAARRNGRIEVVTLILTGIGVNAIAGAGIGLGLFLADDAQLRGIVFWSLGSAGGATWPSVMAVVPCVALAFAVVPRFSRALNLLVLGDREARHLGVDVERVRLALLACSALVTGALVAVAGIVGFVGLVAPHIVRLLTGPDHRLVLPASALTGAVLLLFADLAARTVAMPRELPLGVVTAFAGGPLFLWLLFRTRGAQGGWG